MKAARSHLLLAAFGCLLLGAALSWGKLRYHCRVPASEACVWGKSYFPWVFPMETLAFAIGFVILLLIVRVIRHR